MEKTAGKMQIGAVIFDPAGNQLLAGGKATPLEPRLVRLLEELCAAGGEPVSRETLLSKVSTLPYAGDEALTQAISKLRQALGDTPKGPRYIKTIPRKGYALVAPVTALEGTPLQTTPLQTTHSTAVVGVRASHNHLTLLLLAGAVLLLSALVIWLQLFPSETVRETELILDGDQEFTKKDDWEFIEKKDIPVNEQPPEDPPQQTPQ